MGSDPGVVERYEALWDAAGSDEERAMIWNMAVHRAAHELEQVVLEALIPEDPKP